MAENEKEIDVETLDPARRAELGVSAATDDLEQTEDVVIVDEKLRAKEEARLAEARRQVAEAAEVTAVTEERTAAPVVEVVSTRNAARLLVLTRDASVYTEGSPAAYHLKELAQMFMEVHVIVLNEREHAVLQAERVGESIWLYPTNSMLWWRTAFDAKNVAKKQLTFGGGFRADIILTKDPFESGFAGHMIAKKFDRPLQTHVSDDFFDPYFAHADKRNSWRLVMANFVLRRAHGVRTPSEYLKGRMLEKFKNLSGRVELLPVYYNLDAWKDAPALFNVRERYPQFKFILLHISSMNSLSHTDVAIDGLFYILRQYPTIGLVIVGDGPELTHLQELVEDYELQKQIIFETPDIDVLSLMKSAQLLIHTSEGSEFDEVIFKAAAAGLPMVCGSRGTVSELFIDEESVLLCPVDSPPCFGEKVNRLLNDNNLRHKLTMNARDVVFSSIEQDYGRYMQIYQQNIEQTLATES